MREIVHMQAGQCGNQIGAKVRDIKLQITRFISSNYCSALNWVGSTPFYLLSAGIFQIKNSVLNLKILNLCLL